MTAAAIAQVSTSTNGIFRVYRGNSGALVSGANPPVQQAGPNSKYTLQSGQPVTAAEFNAARTQTVATTRQGSQATAEIYRRCYVIISLRLLKYILLSMLLVPTYS